MLSEKRAIIVQSERTAGSLAEQGWTRLVQNSYGITMESPGAEKCDWCDLVDPTWEDGCTEEGCGFGRA